MTRGGKITRKSFISRWRHFFPSCWNLIIHAVHYYGYAFCLLSTQQRDKEKKPLYRYLRRLGWHFLLVCSHPPWKPVYKPPPLSARLGQKGRRSNLVQMIKSPNFVWGKLVLNMDYKEWKSSVSFVIQLVPPCIMIFWIFQLK